MSWVFAVLLVLVVGAVAVAFAHGVGGLAPTTRDRPEVRLPEGPLTAEDLRAVRFNTAVRGYRADEVDALLARLVAELEGRDQS